MKKIYSIVIITAGMLVASRAIPDDACSHVDDAFFKKNMPSAEITVLSKKPSSGLCEVILSNRGQVISIYAGNDFIISGRMYKNNACLTEETLDGLRKATFKKYYSLLSEATVFTISPKKKGPRIVYLFTDPLCPYCNHVEGKLEDVANRYGATIHVILVAVNGKKSKEKCVEAACRGADFSSYRSADWKKASTAPADLCEKGKTTSDLADDLSDKLLVNGVPSFYLDSGKFINGPNIPALEAALED